MDQGKLIRADSPVASKLKCPVLLASEMSGLDWECGKVRLLFGPTFPSRCGKATSLCRFPWRRHFHSPGLMNGPPHADQT